MKRLLAIILFLSSQLALYATHNRAGEITYKHVNNLKYQVTVVTYTDPNSPADRPELEIKWGDGTLDTISRTSITSISGIIQKNTYVAEHTYPGAASYRISVEDPNRNANVLNIPNSVNTTFYIESWLKINPFALDSGLNNSPQLLNPPIDNACVGKIYIHNPGAFDVDGDSLSYRLVDCKGPGGASIIGYQYPDQISPGPANQISLNSITGDFVWNTPQMQGEYNIAILIEEWRNGVNIGSVLRDLQITVGVCNHDPPQIAPINPICVKAGDTLSLLINAVDPDGQNVTLTANGGPLVLSISPAQFIPPPFNGFNVTGQLYWETKCDHVRKQNYQVNFKAQDDGSINPVLSDLESVLIKVIGPPPLNPAAIPQGNAIRVRWDQYSCTNATNILIYRRIGSSGYVPGVCETGVPASTGYQLIHTTSSISDTSYVDNNNGAGLIPGEQYCYLLVAKFPDGALSCASVEFCAILKKDVPIITNVSVDTTHATAGEMYLAWSKPTEHDTISFPGPDFRYVILRSPNNTGTGLAVIDSTMSINDTIYQDSLFDTQSSDYTYRIDLFHVGVNGRQLVGSSTIASSIFVSLAPSDNKLTLTWNENVPWTNSEYTVYRLNPATSQFDSIGTTALQTFTDSSLANGLTYCYKVRSTGAYSAPGIISPLINYSQEVCGEPEDNEPPCAPVVTMAPDCENLINTLHWTNPNNYCADDVIEFRIYSIDQLGKDFSLLATIPNGTDTSYTYGPTTSIAGCYYVTAIDSFGNESVLVDTVCIDNCPEYILPNVFTPGGDGKNDLFIPFPYRYVESIDLVVFNRWGQEVFKTTDPDVLWDGKNAKNGKQLSDGTYYYICKVNEIRLVGIVPRTLKGTVTLLNNQKTAP